MIDYFALPSTAEEGVLRQIKGNFRRFFVQKSIEKDGLESIPPPWTEHDLNGVLSEMLQREEPAYRGGEDLPDLEETEVEIARMSLTNSVHGEVTSLRARPGGKRSEILFRMVDEYEDEIVVPINSATGPLTTEQVLSTFRDSDPPAVDVPCEKIFQSYFYPDIDELAERMNLKSARMN